MRVPYYHVDAFTSTQFAGNPAGVCVLDAFPSDELMLRIAAENRHSQTAFMVQRPDTDYDLRWFTPEIEDDLCGHATLAAAFVLEHRAHAGWPLRFHTRSGVLTVERDSDRFVMDFPAWIPQPCDPPDALLPALGLTSAQVMKTRDYLVIVESADQVRSLVPDIDALARIEMGIGGVIVTAPSEECDYVLRFFAPSVGIDEDPATGSVHCTLAPYWSARLGKRLMLARQLSARTGELRCELAGDRVRIAGQACLYLEGIIEI